MRQGPRGEGARRGRPVLQAALGPTCSGDALVACKLDRLVRSLEQLTETVEDLERRGGGFRSPTEAIGAAAAGGRGGPNRGPNERSRYPSR